tara:strand:+ start:38 stop:328 length:291 start_codon:yes stop_codon:yes gene_type:complete
LIASNTDGAASASITIEVIEVDCPDCPEPSPCPECPDDEPKNLALTGGKYKVFVNDVELSRHSQYKEAVEKSVNHIEINPDDKVRIKMVEVRVDWK